MSDSKNVAKIQKPVSVVRNSNALKKESSLLHKFVLDLKFNKILLLMSLPGLILLVLFRYLPMYGILISFQNFSLFLGMKGSEWVGFDNFTRFFKDPYFFRLIKNTFLLGLYNIIWAFPAPIILAIMLNEVKNEVFKRATQTITYMPYFISTVIVVGILKSIFASDGGIINKIIMGLGGENVAFFNVSKYFRTMYIASDIWQGVGYGSIVYLAVITGIDPQLYEAAKIDGATRIKSIIHITIPCMIPTIAILLTLRIGAILSVGFEKIFLMYSPAIYETADVISTYVYRKGILDADFGYATAVGLFNSIISIILLVGANLFSRKVLQESLW